MTRRQWQYVGALLLGVVALALLLWLAGGHRGELVDPRGRIGDGKAVDHGAQLRGVGPCAEEDSAWCWRRDDGITYVNLAPADPAPQTLRLEPVASKLGGEVDR